jgi:hypothetical protein
MAPHRLSEFFDVLPAFGLLERMIVALPRFALLERVIVCATALRAER